MGVGNPAGVRYLPNEDAARVRRRAVQVSPQMPLKPGRTFSCDVEGSLERHASFCQCAFVEEAADQRDAVRHTARWREPGQWMLLIGSPIAARLRLLDKAGAQRQRGMTGIVADHEHLVP